MSRPVTEEIDPGSSFGKVLVHPCVSHLPITETTAQKSQNLTYFCKDISLHFVTSLIDGSHSYARDVVQCYHDSIGGRPENPLRKTEPKQPKRRRPTVKSPLSEARPQGHRSVNIWHRL